VYNTRSVPFKDHYILWFPDRTPFLLDVTNFTATVRFLLFLEYAKHNTGGEHYLSDKEKVKKKIKRTTQKRSA